ncbi:MAG: hypothetical protein HYV27_20485 [Candidatus Hydrogenedentes bacterium]|nr:hypothetical protein [Candidatus Hydrogenedentota bacterium]
MELVVVIALLGIITAMIVPIYSTSITRVQVGNARSDMVSVIRYVQERAVSDALEYRIFFDLGENAYWVGYGVREEDGEKRFYKMNEDLGEWQVLPPYIEIEGVKARRDDETGDEFLACYPNGSCDEVELNFRDNRSIDRTFRLRTVGVLGAIEVKSNDFNW